MRPRDDDLDNDGNSQDIVSDEELEIWYKAGHKAGHALTAGFGRQRARCA